MRCATVLIAIPTTKTAQEMLWALRLPEQPIQRSDNSDEHRDPEVEGSLQFSPHLLRDSADLEARP